MPCSIRLFKKAHKDSSYFIEIKFKNEYGVAMPPGTLYYTVKDEEGNVINNLVNKQVASPSATTVIALSGDDLEMEEKYSPAKRFIKIWGSYTSPNKANAAYVRQGWFEIENPEI